MLAVPDLVRQVEALLGPQQVRPLLHSLLPGHAAFDVDRVQFGGRRARGVLAQERDGAHAFDRLARSAQVEDAEVEAAGTLRLGYHGGEGVREISNAEGGNKGFVRLSCQVKFMERMVYFLCF